MKNYILIFFFSIGSWTQAQQESNLFSNGERSNENAIGQEEVPEARVYAVGDPGNPDGDGDTPPVPVDDYIPLLILTAVGIIVYKTNKKIKVTL